jgi:dTDP-4-dehydrorhamnose reductase
VGAVKEHMKVLVVGQSGQLGRSISREFTTKMNLISFNSREHNLVELSAIRKPIIESKPDVIINAAAWTNVDAAESNESLAREANALIPSNLATLARELSIPFYQISTDYVFAGIASIPWEVNSPTNPDSVYGVTKLEGEMQSLEIYREGTRILRTAWLYSCFGKNFVKTMIRLALQNKNNISVVSDQYGQPTSAIDLANQIQLCLSLDLPPGIYHATNSGSATWNEFAREIFLLLDEDPERVLKIDSKGISRAAARPIYSVLSHDCWQGTGIEPMRDWRNALATQIEEIAYIVKTEENL